MEKGIPRKTRAERRNSCRVTTTGDWPPKGSGLVALPRQKRALETKPVPARCWPGQGIWLVVATSVEPRQPHAAARTEGPKIVAQQPQPAAQRSSV